MDERGQNKKIIDLDKEFRDIEGITEKKLNIGLWYVEHRRKMRAVFISFLVLIAAASWVYTIYGYAYYLARGMDEDEFLARQIVQTDVASHEYIETVSPQDLSYSPAGVLKANGKKYDFFAQIDNPNERHWAAFDYYFLVGGRETGRVRGFIFPKESKYLMALAEEFSAKPTSAQFKVENISWRRLDSHIIPDWEEYRLKRLNIAVSDVQFLPGSASGLAEKIDLNHLKFGVANNTAYNYWEVGFLILLQTGANVVGVNRYALSEFMSGEKREVTIAWLASLPQISKVSVVPEVNIMDEGAYIRYEGGTGREK